MNQYVIRFWCQILFHHMATPRFIYFFISWQTLGCFWFVLAVFLSLSVKGEKDLSLCHSLLESHEHVHGVVTSSLCDAPGT